MNHSQSHTPAPDLWLESQKEAIRALKPGHKVDVTDAVMQRIATMPIPTSMDGNGATQIKIHSRKSTILKFAAAACVVGVIATAAVFINNNSSPITASSDLSARLYDVYEYCNDYEDYEYDAAYYDNPVSYFL